MSSPGTDENAQSNDLVFCHACQNEWMSGDHGLQCPECHSEAVEIIDTGSDPRDNIINIADDDDDDDTDGLRASDQPGHGTAHHPLHQHNPWQHGPPDPDEPDIEHVEWNPGPGLHFSRTTYRSSTPGGAHNRGQADPFSTLFENFNSLFQHGGPNNQARAHGHAANFQAMPGGQTWFGPQHVPHHHGAHHHGPQHSPQPTRHVFMAGSGQFPNNRNGMATHMILNQLLAQMQNNIDAQNHDGQAENRPRNPFAEFFASIFGNGTHGDAVYTDEALDRIISQMMEQAGGSTAPGPASTEAIAALPKKHVDKSMLDESGKAECSVCMEAVELGQEVTELPCHHWFHGECVGAWLKEHDTCPHCRQGIMPKDEPSEETPSSPVRSPTQPPRHGQFPFLVAQMGNNQHVQGQQPGPPMPGQFPIPRLNTSPMQQQQQPTMPGNEWRFRASNPSTHSSFPSSYFRTQNQDSRHQSSSQSPYTPSLSSGLWPPPSPASGRPSSHNDSHRRHSSSSQRSGSHRSEGGSSHGHSGGGVTGWFRSLRNGGSGGGNR